MFTFIYFTSLLLVLYVYYTHWQQGKKLTTLAAGILVLLAITPVVNTAVALLAIAQKYKWYNIIFGPKGA